MKINSLFESIKFGQKEMQAVKDASDSFRVGVEYEFNLGEHIRFDTSELDTTDLFKDTYEKLKDALSDEDFDIDGLYSEFISEDYMDGIEFMGSDSRNATYFNGLIELVFRLSQELKNIEKPDTETQDLFGDEGVSEGYRKLMSRVAKQVEDFRIEDTGYMDIRFSHFIEVCYLYDIVMHGDAFNGDDDLIREFWDFVKFVRLGGDTLQFSESENPDDEILRFVKFIRRGSLGNIPDPEEFQYEFDGFNADSITSDEIIEYEEEHGALDFLDSAWTVFLQTNEELNEPRHHTELDTEDLETAGVDTDNIREITTDHYEMIEVITNPMPVMVALKNIEEMFEFIASNASTYDYAGMHISISTTEHDLDDFNMMKFVTLMDLPHILKYFPERDHVHDLYDIVQEKMSQALMHSMPVEIETGSTMAEIASFAIQYAKIAIDSHKEQSIKFGDYQVLNGRIELRFFGGENYHTRKDEIYTHLLRALYLLTFAYTDEHENTYRKKLAKMVNEIFRKRLGVSYSLVYKALLEIHKIDPEGDLDDLLCHTDDIEDEKVRTAIEKVLKRYFKNEQMIKQVRNFFR